MKVEDIKINYRPELARILQNIEDLAIKIYQANYAEIFFKALSETYENENPELAAYLDEITNIFSNPNGQEIFVEKYKTKLLENYDIPIYYVFPSYQIRIVLEVYKEQFDAFEQQILKNYPDLTKQEEYMVKSFMRKISAPARNPNFANGYYEKNISEFYRYIESHIEYIKRECSIPIEQFNISDKPETENENDIDR